MVLKNKITKFFNNQFSLSIFEIALAGLFVALFVISSKVIRINFGFMQMGIVYAWVITIGLIFKPFLAFIIAIIADTLVQMLNGFGSWMIEYAIIYPAMALLVSFFKKMTRCKKDFWWAIFSFLTMFLAIGVSLAISIIYRNFASNSQNEDSFFLFNSTFVKIILWIFIFLIMSCFLGMILLYFKTKNARLKLYVSILVITTLVIIIFVWLWGPIAQIRYLQRHNGKNIAELYQKYRVFLVPRILKTAITLPLYVVIASNIYWVYESLNFHLQKQNQW